MTADEELGLELATFVANIMRDATNVQRGRAVDACQNMRRVIELLAGSNDVSLFSAVQKASDMLHVDYDIKYSAKEEFYHHQYELARLGVKFWLENSLRVHSAPMSRSESKFSDAMISYVNFRKRRAAA